MKYEYVVGVKTSRGGTPHVHSAQTLTLHEAKSLVQEWNAQEQRQASEEGRVVTKWYVALFRVVPPWQEILDTTV